MEITVTEIGPSHKGVKLFVSADNVKKDYQKKISEINKNVNIPGFRPGKAPQRIVEKRFKKDILSEMKRDYLVKCFDDLTNKHKIRPIEEPDVNFDEIKIDETTEFSYELDMEMFPEIPLKEEDYKGLEGSKKAVTVLEEELQQSLDQLRQRKGEWVPVEDGSKSTKEDFLVCNAKITVEDTTVFESDSLEVILHNPTIKGISLEEDDVIGQNVDYSFEKEVTLPENFSEKDYAGKQAKLFVKIIDIKRLQLPELSDDFAQDMGTENLEDLKNKVSEQIKMRKEDAVNADLEHDLIHQLGHNTEVLIPENFLQKCVDEQLESERKKQLDSGKKEDEIELDEEKTRKDVIHDLKETFIINHIADEQNITVSEKEVTSYINEIAYAQGGYWPHELRKIFEKESFKQDVYMRLKNQKVLEFLRENAKVTIVEETKEEAKETEAKKSEEKKQGKNKKKKK